LPVFIGQGEGWGMDKDLAPALEWTARQLQPRWNAHDLA